ncbi:MAG: tetratricopeptide repeat protein [Chitinophagales bacterium]|nr:tetratricopeptide repeat protein [Chitinophagales bacterium]
MLCLNSCAKDYVKEAQIAYNNKNYQQVIEIANKGLAKKENKELLSLRGLSYFELKYFKQASEDLNKVIIAGSGSLEVLEKSVQVNLYLDRNDLAVLGYKELLKGYPLNEEYYYHRAEAYTNLGEYNKAMEDLDKAISIDSNYLQAINQKGIVYQNLRKFDSAIIYFSKAINFNKTNDPEVLFFNRGVSFLELNKFKEAKNDFNYSIKLNSNIGIVFYNRAIVNSYLGEKDSCCKDLEQAMALGYKDIDIALLDYCNKNPLKN